MSACTNCGWSIRLAPLVSRLKAFTAAFALRHSLVALTPADASADTKDASAVSVSAPAAATFGSTRTARKKIRSIPELLRWLLRSLAPRQKLPNCTIDIVDGSSSTLATPASA